MAAESSAVLAGLLLLVLFSASSRALPIVSFRLDEVQPFWCENITQTVIDVFLEEGVPLNVGIVGEDLDYGVTVDTYLNSLAGNSLIEMASNSFRFLTYKGKNYTWQHDDMETNNAMILEVTTEEPYSLIPPLNKFDSNTTLAARANGMRVLSAECSWSLTEDNTVRACKDESNVVAPDIVRDDMYMLPAGAVLGGEEYWNNFVMNASLSDAINWIELQIENQGFSVVMLHPVEFAMTYDCLNLNPQKIQILKDLFAYGASRWEYKTFTDAAATITADVTPTGMPSGVPTGAPSMSFSPSLVPSFTFRPSSVFEHPNPVVSFRLDDVQALWCEDITETVIDFFLSENVPINVGLFGQNLDVSTWTQTYLGGLVGNPLVEMLSNGYRDVSYVGKTFQWQFDDIWNSMEMIEGVTTAVPNSFIPPNNKFDENTPWAAKANDLTIFSAVCRWSLSVPNTTEYCPGNVDVVSPDLYQSGVFMLPAGAVLGGQDYWTDFSLDANLADAIKWIEHQIYNQGFSVVMLNPEEFTTSPTCDTLDFGKMQILKDLIDYGRTRWQYMTFSDAVFKMTSAVTPTSVPSTFPSNVPTIESTGYPTGYPSSNPTCPTAEPSLQPSSGPTFQPSRRPTFAPSISPAPSMSPTIAVAVSSADSFFNELAANPLLLGVLIFCASVLCLFIVYSMYRAFLTYVKRGWGGEYQSPQTRDQRGVAISSKNCTLPRKASFSGRKSSFEMREFSYDTVYDSPETPITDVANPFKVDDEVQI